MRSTEGWGQFPIGHSAKPFGPTKNGDHSTTALTAKNRTALASITSVDSEG
jgi:hypothetical protein